MQHQPSSGAEGTAADIELRAKEIIYARTKVNQLLARHTGQPVERIERDFDRDNYMSAEQARAYGIIDHVVSMPGEVIDESARPAVTA
jgi:ATP-dependent Clp protease protease subunit